MAFIGTFSRALLDSATEVYFGGVSVSILDAQGNVILGDNLPDAPAITSTIADRVYEAGDGAVTVDLRTKFDGATSYTVSPANAAVTITDHTLTINPTAAMTATSFAVRGVNGGGASNAITFTLTVTAPVPVLLKPFPDQGLTIGGGTVTLPLGEYFSGAVGHAVSPTGQGVTISNGNLVISRTTARDIIITVTATNATGQDRQDSFALLIAAPANQAPVASPVPAQAPTANVAFTANLASYFTDPEGATLIFDYTGTLPTGITRNGAVFSGTATVAGQTASGVLRARDPGNLEAEAPVTWQVASQPSLTATIAPNPPLAGQPATLTFNVLPDNIPSVSHGPTALTVTRVGTSLAYATSPLGPNDALNLVAGAGKATYTAFSATYDVVPAPPSLVVTPAQEIELRSLSATSGPVTVTITHPAAYAGTHTIAWADIATAPHWVVAPKATEAAGALTMTPGLPAWDDTAGPTLTRTRQWLRGTAPGTATPIGNATGLTYTVVPASDGGQTIYPSETVTDGLGRSKTSIGTGIAVAAAGLASGVTHVGDFGLLHATNMLRELPIDLGPADPNKTVFVVLNHPANYITSRSIVADGVDYPLTTVVAAGSSGSSITIYRAAIPAGGAATLKFTFSSNSSGPFRASVFASKDMAGATVTKAQNNGTAVAGTPISLGTFASQPGDVFLTGITAGPVSDAGAFDTPVGVVEIMDTRTSPSQSASTQMFVGRGVETAATASKSLSVIPQFSGGYGAVTAQIKKV